MHFFKKILAIAVLLLLAVVIFHKSLLLFGCRSLLNRWHSGGVGEVVSYDTLQWEESAIVLRGLSVKTLSQELSIDLVKLEWHFDLSSFCLSPTIDIVHPQLCILELSSSSQESLPLLYRTPRFQPHFSISNGVLQFPSSRFYFSVSQEEIGELLTLSHQPDLSYFPLLKAAVSHEGERLHVDFEFNETDLSRSTPLLTFLFPFLHREHPSFSGEITLEGEVLFDLKEGLKELTFQAEASHLEFTKNQERQVQCHDASCSVFYSSQEESLGISCLIEDAHVFLPSGWSVENLKGSLTLRPQEELEAHFHGDLSHLEQVAKLGLDLKGALSQQGLHLSSCCFEGEGLELRASITEQLAQMSLQGDAQRWLCFAIPSLPLTAPLDINMNILVEREKGGFNCSFAGPINQDVFEGSALFSLSSLNWKDLMRGVTPVLQFKEAVFQSPQIHLEKYASFVKPFFPDLKMEGSLSCSALLCAEQLQMTLQPEDLSIHHALATAHFPSFLGHPFELAYQWKSGEFFLEIPFSQATLSSTQADVAFEKLSGVIKCTEKKIEIPSFEGVCEGIAIQGALKVDLLKEKLLTLSTSQIDASFSQIQNVLKRLSWLPQMPLITGQFHSGQKGFLLTLPLDTPSLPAEFVLKGKCSAISFPLNAATALQEGSCEILFDSKSKCLTLEKGEGKWNLLNGTSLSVQAKRLTADFSHEPTLNFSLRVLEGKKEFVQLEGKMQQMPSSSWELSLDPKFSHVAAVPLNLQKCVLDQAGNLCSFEIRPLLKMQEIYPLALFLKDSGILSATFDLNPLLHSTLQGKVQLRLFSEEFKKGISLEADSTDLRIQENLYTPFHLRAHQSKEAFVIDELQAGPLSLKGSLNLDQEGFTLPQFEGNWKTFSLKGSCYFKTKTKQLHCSLESIKSDLSFLTTDWSGNLTAGMRVVADFSDPSCSFYLSGEANGWVDLQTPVPLSIQNKKLIRFTYHPQEGIVSEGLDLQIKERFSGGFLGGIKSTKLLSAKGGSFFVKGIELSMTPALIQSAISANYLSKNSASFHWEGNLQLSGDLQLTPTGAAFQGFLAPGRYGWDDKLLNFEQIQLSYDKKALHLRSKAQIEGQPLWSSLQLDLDKEIYGVLKLFDHPKAEGLKMTFRSHSEGFLIESVQGSCYGLNCRLKPQMKRKLLGASSLTGDIQIDLSRLTLLLPDTVQKALHPLKLGSGYEWQGDLVLWQDRQKGYFASGTLRGKEFEALGYRFGRLQATMDANPQRILLSQLKIEEADATIEMKKFELAKQQDKWLLHIPQIQVNHLQPSVMRKIDAPISSVKPFIIQDFTLADIRGELGHLSSLQGSGYLTFANQFRKETSLLDLPLEMIKKIGLDLGLLTPVEGELQIELRGDKFYLLSLDHAFSEAKRSEFYLAPSKHLSYIDLTGAVHIDLKMRQDVMLKMIEPFTLTIRGTLDKPRYGLQF